MGRLPEEWIHSLLERLDIRSIVERYVPLREKGGRLWACCPFHQEKTPSFSVSPDKGFFYCYGCHKGGSVVQFVSEIEHISFREACERLAEEAGLELPTEAYTARSREQKERQARLNEMNRELARFYAAQLYAPHGRAALSYLRRRGLNNQDIRSNGLGFAPDSWQAGGDYLLSKGFSKREMTEGGLQKMKNNHSYDVFRNRVMFPILDPQNNVIGFGGRVMDGSEPKYLNSPETVSFNKSRNLYHLNVARSLRNLPHFLLMEGYMDVVSVQHFGINEAVATLGTALTRDQAWLLKRYGVPVYICYDGDEAGIKAAVRASGILRASDIDTRVVVFPDGKDPDEFIRTAGSDAFAGAIKNALDPVLFRFWVLSRDVNMQDQRQKARYVTSCVKILQEEKSAVSREEYARVLAKQTGYSSEAILADVSESDTSDVAAPAGAARDVSSDTLEKAEEYIAAYLAAYPEHFPEVVRQINVSDFANASNAAVFAAVAGFVSQGIEPSKGDLLSSLDNEEDRKHAASLFGRLDDLAGEGKRPHAYAEGCIAQIKLRAKKKELEETTRLCSNSSGMSPEEQARLVRRSLELTRSIQQLRTDLARSV